MNSISSCHSIYQVRVASFNCINYSYIIVDDLYKKAAIVDPAWELNAFTSRLEKLNVNVEAVLLTHSHYDHVNMVNQIVELYDSQVYMSKSEVDYYGFKCKNLNLVNNMDILRLGCTKISFLLTPGHTLGSMCFFLSDSLFTGDTVFIEGCGACNFGGGSAEMMYESIQKIKRTIPSYIRVYPGHSFGKSPGVELGSLMKENIYMQIDNKQIFVDYRMRPNQKKLFAFK